MRKILLLIATLFSLAGNVLSAQDTYTVDETTYGLLKDLSRSKLATGKVILFTTTHEDIAWLNEPEICKIDRDRLWLAPYLERLRTEPDFKMDIEQSSIVMEYLHRHPEQRDLFVKLVKEGRIGIGAAYVQAYEEMYSGEALARQFYLGKKWLADNLDGYESKTYFNVDVPGRTLQMPQIAAKAGVENLVLSRHIKGLFNWEAPDGSKIRCYSPGNHYMDFYNLLGMEEPKGIEKMVRDAVDWYTIYNNSSERNTVMPTMLNYEFIWDQSPVENSVPFIKKWNAISRVGTEGKKALKVELPKFEYGTADGFFEKVGRTTSIQRTLKGERPNTWIYIHGASHHHAISASRQGDILMTQAEKFATANAMLNGSFAKYPEMELKRAWEAKIYPDHGWGGKGGDVTDNVFLQKFLFAKSEAGHILNDQIRSIARKIGLRPDMGMPVVVFNSLSWERTGPVSFLMNFAEDWGKGFQLVDLDHKEQPVQLTEVEYHPNGNLKSATVQFIANGLPSIGYATYYARPTAKSYDQGTATGTKSIENKFYSVRFGNGGLESIIDKELGVELIDHEKFMAGEVFAMSSIGNGAGEFAKVQKPDMGFFDRLALGATRWEIDVDGPLFTTLKMRQPMKEAVVEMSVKIYHTVKKIDFDVDLLNWDGVMYREFRMALPLAMQQGKVTYEVPYGSVTVGEGELEGNGGEFYTTPVREIRPRAIENWISANNDKFGVTLSSSVVTADWLDPTDSLNTQTILQPILLASRKSCHHEGNDYHQTGDHHFSFSLTSHVPGWKKGQRFGKESNEKAHVVVGPERFTGASLPEKMAFFKTDKKNLVITTVKKAEDSNDAVMRLYDTDNLDSKATITISSPIGKAWHTNLLEGPLEDLESTENTVEMNVGHHAIETMRWEWKKEIE
ncbi:MAG: glycosyl hydrolase-related protein [Sediminicola sp.]